MDRVFNMGIGLVIVVAEYFAEAIVRQLSHRLGIPAWIIGEVISGEKVGVVAMRAGDGRRSSYWLHG